MQTAKSYFVDITTVPEWFFRIGLGLSAIPLIFFQFYPMKIAAMLAASTLVFIVLCLGWNDQYELSRDEGLILNRTLFGFERRVVVRSPERLDATSTKRYWRLVKEQAFLRFPVYAVRYYYRPVLVDKAGKKFALGPLFPNLSVLVPNWDNAQWEAEKYAKQVGGALRLPFRA